MNTLRNDLQYLTFSSFDKEVKQYVAHSGILNSYGSLHRKVHGGGPVKWQNNALFEPFINKKSAMPERFYSMVIANGNRCVGAGFFQEATLGSPVIQYFFKHPSLYEHNCRAAQASQFNTAAAQNFFHQIFGKAYDVNSKMGGMFGVIVDPDFQSSGLSRKLYQPLIDYAKSIDVWGLVTRIRTPNIFPSSQFLIENNIGGSYILENLYVSAGIQGQKPIITIPRIAFNMDSVTGHNMSEVFDNNPKKPPSINLNTIIEECRYKNPNLKNITSNNRLFLSKFGTHLVEFLKNFAQRKPAEFYGAIPDVYKMNLFNQNGKTIPYKIFGPTAARKLISGLIKSGSIAVFLLFLRQMHSEKNTV